MNTSILISIHPEHVANILSGKKIFEYRKVMPARNISHIVLYSTSPVKRIVAIAEVVHYLTDSLTRVWHKTANGSGITHQFFLDYFLGSTKAGYFALGNVYELSKPLEINQLISCKIPPQSFCYLNPNDTRKIHKIKSSVPIVRSSF